MVHDLLEKEQETKEQLAWNFFLAKTGFRFIRELTPEEKKSITDVESYQYYRDLAQKAYDKKVKALSNKKYPVIEVPSTGKTRWMGGAYCLCFVYSKYNGNFVLKGYYKEVEEYLKKNYTHYFCNKTLWYQGMSRDIWDFWKESIFIYHPSVRDRKKGQKIQVRPYMSEYDGEDLKGDTLYFKRLPKRWIPEFDNL
jgi:hypothetical protein